MVDFVLKINRTKYRKNRKIDLYSFQHIPHLSCEYELKIDHISKTKSRRKEVHELKNHFQSNAHLS